MNSKNVGKRSVDSLRKTNVKKDLKEKRVAGRWLERRSEEKGGSEEGELRLEST